MLEINFHKFLRIIYLLIFFPLIILVVVNYEENIFFYLLFSTIILIYIIESTKKNSTIVLNLLTFFFFFGLWFKFSVNYLFDFKYISNVGSFKQDLDSVNSILYISTIALISFLIPNFLIKTKTKKKIDSEKYLKIFFMKYSKRIIFLTFIVYFFVIYFNFENNIYQKGIIPSSNYKISYYVISYLLSIGFVSIFSYFVFFKIKNNLHYLTILLVEGFFTSISLVSRILPLTYFIYCIGVFKCISITKKKLNSFLIYLFIIILFILVSVTLVTKLRNDRFIKINDSSSKNINQNKITTQYSAPSHAMYYFDIIINRIPGIDGVMAVYASPNKSFEFYFQSWLQNELHKNTSFYEKNYLFKNTNNNKIYFDNKIVSQNSPGIIAHLFYTNSYIFLFIASLIISFVLNIFDRILNYFYKNKIFVTLLLFHLVYRIIHFGFAPSNSYKLFLAILVTMVIPYLFNLFLKKIYVS